MRFMLPWPTHDRYFEYESGTREPELCIVACRGGHLLGNRRGEFCRNTVMSVPVTHRGLQPRPNTAPERPSWSGGKYSYSVCSTLLTPLCKESNLCPFMSQICGCKFSVREMFLLAGAPRKHVNANATCFPILIVFIFCEMIPIKAPLELKHGVQLAWNQTVHKLKVHTQLVVSGIL